MSNNIVAALASGVVNVYDLNEGHLTAQLAGHTRCVNAISAHPSKPIVSCSLPVAALMLPHSFHPCGSCSLQLAVKMEW